jgi:ElaB/YqjD/DUF883 family membrane-anchored ribosome-binding protein
MRDHKEIVDEIHEARRDLAVNIDGLRDAIEEKIDVRAQLEKRLAPLAEQTRQRPMLMVGVAVAAGALVALVL